MEVPLAGGRHAILDAEDFDRIVAAGFSDQWAFNSNGSGLAYVRCGFSRATGRLVTVARLIMEPTTGFVVRYRDGDRLNLRRANPYLQGGRSKQREAVLMQDARSVSDASEPEPAVTRRRRAKSRGKGDPGCPAAPEIAGTV